MCSYITQKVALFGSAKGASGWRRVDAAHVYFDHPFDAPLDHALGLDIVSEAQGARERIALELSADSARALAEAILAALARGEAEHGAHPASADQASIPHY
ncbi:MAG: DUF6295 family protein [Beijerinckiaceae bacterium]|jgi:hypothetical protein